jgi:cytochrome c peroxidase
LRKITTIIALSVIASIAIAFHNEPVLFFVPDGWPAPVYDFSKNELTHDKVELGRKIFYDPLVSGNNTVSCESCHSPYTAFTHVDHALSHGIHDRVGTRNTPALMNLAWQSSFMHDGAINHLDMQALAPISSHTEMDSDISDVVKKFSSDAEYPKLFAAVYGRGEITGEKILKSLSAFMLTLVTANSRYDSVGRGLTSYTAQENNGYQIFKRSCASCHPEPLFTNNQFMNNGLPADTALADLGRYNVTKNPTDFLKFKVPTLRNIEFSFPYMHDGRFKNLSQVLNHYTTGIVQSVSLAEPLQYPIRLTSNEKVDLTAFLLTLTDKSFLFNPRFVAPRRAVR